MKSRIGFTLIQMSLLGAILSTATGIVAPELSEMGLGVKESDFLADLQTIRSQLELYKIHHNGQLPPTDSFESFRSALTGRDAGGGGPYLLTIPANPYSGDSIVRFESGASTAGCGKAGWVFNTTSGAFQADDSPKHATL